MKSVSRTAHPPLKIKTIYEYIREGKSDFVSSLVANNTQNCMSRLKLMRYFINQTIFLAWIIMWIRFKSTQWFCLLGHLIWLPWERERLTGKFKGINIRRWSLFMIMELFLLIDVCQYLHQLFFLCKSVTKKDCSILYVHALGWIKKCKLS